VGADRHLLVDRARKLRTGTDPLEAISRCDESGRAGGPNGPARIPTRELALLAGSAAAAIFVLSQLPMLIKACRTKDLSSYSLANIGLANCGNVLYAVYLVHVPIGPAWAVHGFNVTTSGLMLFSCLRYRRRPTTTTHAAETTEAPTRVAAREPQSSSLDHRRPTDTGLVSVGRWSAVEVSEQTG